MEKSEFYTKGEKDEVLRRMNQVHTITLYCPLDDGGITMLYSVMDEILFKYKKNMVFVNVPAIDALNAFLYTSSICSNNKINVDKLSIVAASLKSFAKLKYINFSFSYNKELMKIYDNALKEEGGQKTIKGIFKMNRIEMNLSDMFSQEIIDFLNKVMVMNDILPNSVLERKFKIDFKYDEYVSFMNMFLGNNGPALNQMDKNICDYFMTFPDLMTTQKPDIRIITNYGKM